MGYTRYIGMASKDAEDFENSDTVVLLGDVEDMLSDIGYELECILNMMDVKARDFSLDDLGDELATLIEVITK